MGLGLIGRKVGMTRIFNENGESVPVTVIDVSSNRVTQLRRVSSDGYSAVQVAFGERRASRVPRALAGHLSKAGVGSASVIKEFPVSAEIVETLGLGSVLGVEVFPVGVKVDVTGTTIGRGFSGVIRRHNFSSNRASHGNSRSHNTPGSTGMNQDPGRVFPGKKMPGQYGAVTRTIQSLDVVRVDEARQLIMVRGAIPGAEGGYVTVRSAVKKQQTA